ncbi:MAG: HlyD family efflux transporter periplasmic adaptor subunit [Oscillospiraceae bacterium]|nr:HlyD family efflux transporter periplasmic adaptor subunit [Oscillospiraceae bacterium]
MEKTKNREWVKNAAIIFLAVLLVLTFFSNTIMNRSLPEVATQSVTGGNIVARVRGTGTVTANGAQQVKAEGTRQIQSVLVKVGQKVETGDVLFTLGQGASEEIEAAEKNLRTLQASYDRTAANGPIANYSADYLRWQQAKTKRDEAKRALDIAKQAAEAVSSLSEQISLAEAKRDAAKEEYEYRKTEAAARKAELDALLSIYNITEEELEALEARLAELYALAPSAPDTSALYGEILQLETDISVLQSVVDELPTLREERDNLARDLGESLDEENKKTLNDRLKTVLQEIEDAEAKELELLAKKELLQQKREEYARMSESPEDPNAAEIAEIEARLGGVQSAEIEAAIKALAEAEIALDDTRWDYEQAENTLSSLMKALTEEGRVESQIYKEKKEAYDQAELELANAYESLSYQMASLAQQQTVQNVELKNISEDIEAAKKKLADLMGGEDSQITAKVAGTILTVDATAGDTKQKGDILCSIEVPDMGYSLSFSVTNDQANRLRIGDTATVSNFYWGSEITATLSSIKIDQKNPQTNKLLTFDLTGNVTAGSELTISVGQKSANYDIIVPSSAIRSDSNGSFVLRVDAKNSPLGNRYIARRVPVEVLASDDNNSAVSADLGNGDYVITTSSAPVKNGEQVRLSTS